MLTCSKLTPLPGLPKTRTISPGLTQPVNPSSSFLELGLPAPKSEAILNGSHNKLLIAASWKVLMLSSTLSAPRTVRSWKVTPTFLCLIPAASETAALVLRYSRRSKSPSEPASISFSPIAALWLWRDKRSRKDLRKVEAEALLMKLETIK